MSRSALCRDVKVLDRFLDDNPGIRHIDATVFNICGEPCGKRIPVAEARKLYGSGLQLPHALFALDVTGETLDPLGRGMSDGDPDGTCFAIDAPPVLAPWAGEDVAQIVMGMCDDAGRPAPLDPRFVLNKVLHGFSELGLTPVVAVELEFYLIAAERGPDGAPQMPLSPRTGAPEKGAHIYSFDGLDVYSPVLKRALRWCQAAGVPATAMTVEVGPAQFEVNLKHGGDPVKAAEDAALLRYIVRKAARAEGLDATFMAKPFPGQTGNGMHVHLSLADREGRNAFDDAGAEGTALLRHAIGGMIHLMGESLAIFAPNVNSYRRLKPNNFVPVNRDWGYNNRAVAFRVPAGDPAARRIEHRVAGADANPFLVLAAVLAGVLAGIAGKLEPGAPVTGNTGARRDRDLPASLPQALDALKAAGGLARYIGADYLALYHATKLSEYEKFLDHVSPLEYSWYL